MNKVINSVVWIFGAFALLGVMVYALNHPPGKSDEAPTPSYQENNLAMLKSAQPNDLVICVVQKEGFLAPDTKFAIIVDRNANDQIYGSWIDQRAIEPIQNGRSHSILADKKCAIRILRPSETRSATDMIATIILYGLNPR